MSNSRQAAFTRAVSRGRHSSWSRCAWAIALAVGLCASGCDKLGGGSGDDDESAEDTSDQLTESQCRQLIQKRARLESGGNSAVRATRARAERMDINVCLKRGNVRAFRCFKNASTTSELPACERLMK